MRNAKRTSREGYSIIEVMMAVAVMTVGSVGILAMQQASTSGNMFAREVGTANEITRSWVSRVQRDSLLWRTRGFTGAASARYLALAGNPGVAPAWVAPVGGAADESYAYDYFGRPVAAGAGAFYCVNLRFDWAANQDALRVDVRTWWPKARGNESAAAGNEPAPICDATTPDAATTFLAESRVISAVYAETLVRWTLPR